MGKYIGLALLTLIAIALCCVFAYKTVKCSKKGGVLIEGRCLSKELIIDG